MMRYIGTVAVRSVILRINDKWPELRRIVGVALCLVGLAITGCNSLLFAADRPGLWCISKSSLPVYAGLPWQAQLTGTATARIIVGSEGKPLEIKVAGTHGALTAWVKGWLNRTSFLPECKGQTIDLKFEYRLEGARREFPDNQIVIKFPGTFEITAHPPILRQNVD